MRTRLHGLKQGLAEYWRLDEPSGNALGWRGLNLTDNNTVTQRSDGPGRMPFGRQFTVANSEYFNAADPEYLSGPLSAISISAWVYFDSFGADRMICAKGTGGGNAGLEYRLNYSNSAGKLGWLVSDGTTGINVNSNLTINTGQWYHVVVTNNMEVATFIINGAVDRVVRAATPIAAIQNTAGDFYIGRQPSASLAPMDGGIVGLGIWHRVLSPIEAKLIYQRGAHIA